MTVLTIEIPDKETKFVTKFIKKIGGKVTDSQTICDRDPTPNAVTIEAIEEASLGKVTCYKSAKDLVESIDKLKKKSSRIEKQLLTGLETGLKQAKDIQAGRSKGFSVSEIVNGK